MLISSIAVIGSLSFSSTLSSVGLIFLSLVVLLGNAVIEVKGHQSIERQKRKQRALSQAEVVKRIEVAEKS